MKTLAVMCMALTRTSPSRTWLRCTISSTCGVMLTKAIRAGRLKVRYSVSDFIGTDLPESGSWRTAADVVERHVTRGGPEIGDVTSGLETRSVDWTDRRSRSGMPRFAADASSVHSHGCTRAGAQGEIPVKTIDYIYRFDPKNPSVKPSPARRRGGAEDARGRQPDVLAVDGELPHQHVSPGTSRSTSCSATASKSGWSGRRARCPSRRRSPSSSAARTPACRPR